MTSQEKFAAAMAVIGAAFNRPMTPAALEGYWIALQGLTDPELATATRRALTESKFMPAPSELLAFAGKGRDIPAEAALAWQAIRRALAKHDYLVASIDFGPRVNAVLRNLGGWDTLCRATLGELDNPGWLRKRFEEVYGLLAHQDPERLQGEPLGPTAEARGMVGVGHVRVAIEGQPAPRQIAGGRNGTGALGLLAEEKSA